LFLATIFSVFLFNSCANSQTIENEETVFFEQSDRMIKLNKTAEWQHFKTFWAGLDNKTPDVITDFSDNKTALYYAYGGFFINEQEKASILKSELDTNIILLKQTGLVSEAELKSLEIICDERISYLYEIDFTMISHCLPPKSHINKSLSLNSLENKIDTLNYLLYNNLITEEEFNSAFININSEINNILITSTILSNYDGYIYGTESLEDKNNAEQNKLYFEQHFQKLIQNEGIGSEAEKQYNQISKEINEIELCFPTLEELLKDLVGNTQTRIIELQKTDAFKDFKIYWNQMDTIKPDYTDVAPSYDLYEQRGELKYVLDEKIETLKSTGLLTDLELFFLKTLTETRLDVLQGENIYTRMIMPLTYNPNAAFELERKIDILLDLKQKNLINSEEFENALAEVFNLSTQVIALRIINNNFFYNQLDENSIKQGENDIDIYIETLKIHHQKILKELDTEPDVINSFLTETIKKLLEIKATMPTIIKLIESFEK